LFSEGGLYLPNWLQLGIALLAVGSMTTSKPAVFLTHSEPRARDPLKKIIQDRYQLTVDCPVLFETIEI
jgi:hypothetical protein